MTLPVDWTFAAYQAQEFVVASRRATSEYIDEAGAIVRGHVPSVAIVLASFSVEAALKALIAGEQGFREWSQLVSLWRRENGKDGHDLSFLFSKVSAKRRTLIRARLESADQSVQWTRYDYGPSVYEVSRSGKSFFLERIGFETLLTDHSRAFVEWRYMFQSLPGYAIPEFLCDLAEAILGVMEDEAGSPEDVA